ncbi:T9SS type A sorting domain-containing protein [Puia dinghuensis]|uniref:T9SS C-terminal target domain-containing protein n=1 Tax=Puia dinghuensis TaxID=1792502 RepID=A0A8J2XN84_9BACT|nr:T9SS type A sorting domain-containing protein [Puia dinghuensis]GGA82811.1 hypothetical protein GCM10011511_02290 [Puia dinghuensis]
MKTSGIPYPGLDILRAHFFFFLLLQALLLPSSTDAQCGGCSYTETELTTGGMSTIPAGTVVCITTNTCLGATSTYPATCPNSGAGTLTINGTLRICPGVTFSFDGAINGTGNIEIGGGGRMNLYGTYSCNIHMSAVDPDIATGTSASTAVGGCNSSACEPHFADGYAPFGVVATGLGYTVSNGPCTITGYPSNTVLPIALEQFTAAWQGASILLTWTTPGLDQGSWFEADYSTDGVTWKPFSKKIPGIDNNPVAQYSWLATPPPAARYFFHLRYEDAVGNSSYSSVITLDNNSTDSHGIIIEPNPVHSTLSVRTTTSRHYTLQLLDVTGKPILRLPGNPSGEYDLSGLATGTYLMLVITDDGNTSIKRLTKL